MALLLPSFAHAEDYKKVIAQVTVGNYHALGYRAPFIWNTLQFESDNSKRLMIFNVSYSPTNKLTYGDVEQIKTKFAGYLEDRGLFLGGGFTASKIMFIDLHDSRARLASFVGAGFEDGQTRYLITYEQALIDYYLSRVLNGEMAYTRKHFRVGSDMTLYHLNNRTNVRATEFVVDFTIGVVF